VNVDKQVVFSHHALTRCRLRHAEPDEVVEAIRGEEWEPAKSGRHCARRTTAFARPSPITGRVYQWRTIEAIFAEEADRLVVVTVLVKYSNSRVQP
jgi:hypothetical protein